MEVVCFAIIVMVFRACAAIVLGTLKVFSILFFAPLTMATGRPRGGGLINITINRGPVDDEPFWGKRVTGSRQSSASAQKASKPEPAMRTRNHESLIVALKGLGWPKDQAAEMADNVVADLGGDTELNALLKEALKRMGTAK